MEEAELQVFPETGPETELVETMGNRQVRMGFPELGEGVLVGKSWVALPGRAMKWLLFCYQDENQRLQASVPPDSVPSLQSMGLLLDKLAKENQDIRLLQAQLQVGPGKREGFIWPPLPRCMS